MASGLLASAALSRSGPTVIVAAVPIRLRPETLSGCRAEVSSAISEPIEWPTSLAFGAPAASSSAAVQSAMSAMVGSGVPDERPWPGRSGASTE